MEFGDVFDIPDDCCYDNYNDLVNRKDVHVVYVSSLHTFHFTHALAALKAKKNVLVEKPMCVNAKQAEILIQTARENKVLLLEAMWTRHFPLINRIKKTIQNETIGDVVCLEVHPFTPLILNLSLLSHGIIHIIELFIS